MDDDRSTEEQKRVFEEVWTSGNYRLGSPGLRLVPRFLRLCQPQGPINDYGSGTGRAAVALLDAGHPVNMVDIAENALEDEARARLGKGLTFTLASVWDLPNGFPVTDWGYCMEMIMTIPPAKVPATMENIARTCKNLFIQTYHRIDRRSGLDCNLIQEGKEWYESMLQDYFSDVERIESEEIPLRYIFICRGSKW